MTQVMLASHEACVDYMMPLGLNHIFQFDHHGMVFARQRNKTLEVGFDDHGGWCQARLDGCAQGRDLYEAITNGLIDRMSFGFTIADYAFKAYWELPSFEDTKFGTYEELN